jgi:hypothetical protein
MMYGLFVLNNTAVIRDACDGVTDAELETGVRLRAYAPMKSILESMASVNHLVLLKQGFNTEDDGDYEAPVAHKVQRFVINEVFNRGPYSPYWHNKDNSRY